MSTKTCPSGTIKREALENWGRAHTENLRAIALTVPCRAGLETWCLTVKPKTSCDGVSLSEMQPATTC